MAEKITVRPVLKALDHGTPESHIYFDEWVEIPGYGQAQLSFHFSRDNSFEEMQDLARYLKERGLRLVIEKVQMS